MGPRSEELLYLLLWAADQFLSPSFSKFDEPFESWAWRNGLGRRLAQLERHGWTEQVKVSGLTRAIRLTAAGRLVALGGRDPVVWWGRAWDGCWCLVFFDVPVRARALRVRLARRLRALHFAPIQGSVWIGPDLPQGFTEAIGRDRIDVGSFMVHKTQPAGGETNAQFVAAAWDFEAINQRYAAVRKMLADGPRRTETVEAWARREAEAWKQAVAADPLLPGKLWPPGYLGPEVWRMRCEVLPRVLGRG